MENSLTSDLKRCTKCGEEKPRSMYHKRSLSSDGLMAQCKICVNLRIQKNYQANPAKKIHETRSYHLQNQEWSKEYARTWHLENKASRLEKVKKRLTSDPEFLAYRRRQTQQSELKRRAAVRATKVEHITTFQFASLLQEFNGLCWICDLPIENLSWDHVVPLSHGGVHTIENIKPACMICNAIKNDTFPFTEQDRLRIATRICSERALSVKEVMP